jgi:hypothetical protein
MIDTPPQALVIARALRMEGDREAPGNLAINKVMAAAGRREVREIVDVVMVHETILPLGALSQRRCLSVTTKNRTANRSSNVQAGIERDWLSDVFIPPCGGPQGCHVPVLGKGPPISNVKSMT